MVVSMSPTAQIAGFISRFDPTVARLIRDARRALRKRFPTAIELVYDNYNFLVFGFCATERASTCIVSLAADANGMRLAFPYCGTRLPDPHRLLLGAGNSNRFIRLESAAALAQTAVDDLITAAVRHSQAALATDGRGRTIVQSISTKQQPRRREPASFRR